MSRGPRRTTPEQRRRHAEQRRRQQRQRLEACAATFERERLDRLEVALESGRTIVEACRDARVQRQELYALAQHGHRACAQLLERAQQIRSTPRPAPREHYPPLDVWDAWIDQEPEHDHPPKRRRR